VNATQKTRQRWQMDMGRRCKEWREGRHLYRFTYQR